ncbi:helix-turn-helix transcriptional regulator [Marinomonas colpomeniae]|uniref:YafY family transcriptional regulator n=1 Tax=Marinomonas colpomeniae TaxID=2774408 RepID=A0ABR8NWR6_9GAMM|nr:YafY family protein [Marinomonas colpomeniae]MBD5769623.1 YafY family transcriptional regulator [Marinomonas colpomeniae]
MSDGDVKRLSRLAAITTQLQAKSLVTATELAARFSVSVRTIYRDIRALESSGIPIYTEEGKGYRLMEGYRLPPIMFTESEANALVMVEQLVLNNKDSSLVKDYSDAIDKIKSSLNSEHKARVNLLSDRTQFSKMKEQEKNSDHLSTLQYALTNFFLIDIGYTDEANRLTQRRIEPFALFSTRNSWILVAWCRLREGFRNFRLDRIQTLDLLLETFTPHDMTLEDYFRQYG